MGDNNNLYYESENGEASVEIEGSDGRENNVASPIDVDNNHAYRDPYTNEILYGKADLYKLNKTIEPGETYTLPDGFHEGTIIKAKDITDFTYGTATAADIAFNKTAWVNGKKVIGASKASNIPELSATVDDVVDGKTFIGSSKVQATGTIRKTVGHDNDRTITEPINLEGYYKDVTISPPDTSEDDATADHLLLGYVAHSKGKKIVGTMHLGEEAAATISTNNQAQPEDVLETKKFARPRDDGMDVIIEPGTMKVNAPQNIILDNGELYTIPKGYHNGTGILTVPTLASKTPGNATKYDLPIGKKAWVYGKEIVANYKKIPELNDLNNDKDNDKIEVPTSDKYTNFDGGITLDSRLNREVLFTNIKYSDRRDKYSKRNFDDARAFAQDPIATFPLLNYIFALPSSARAYGTVKNINGKNTFVRNTKTLDPQSLSSIIYNKKLISIDCVAVNIYQDKSTNSLLFSGWARYDVSYWNNINRLSYRDFIDYSLNNTKVLFNKIKTPGNSGLNGSANIMITFSELKFHNNDDGFGNFCIGIFPYFDKSINESFESFRNYKPTEFSSGYSVDSPVFTRFSVLQNLDVEVKFFGINYEE